MKTIEVVLQVKGRHVLFFFAYSTKYSIKVILLMRKKLVKKCVVAVEFVVQPMQGVERSVGLLNRAYLILIFEPLLQVRQAQFLS